MFAMFYCHVSDLSVFPARALCPVNVRSLFFWVVRAMMDARVSGNFMTSDEKSERKMSHENLRSTTTWAGSVNNNAAQLTGGKKWDARDDLCASCPLLQLLMIRFQLLLPIARSLAGKTRNLHAFNHKIGIDCRPCSVQRFLMLCKKYFRPQNAQAIWGYSSIKNQWKLKYMH